jgi:hypothetical protein
LLWVYFTCRLAGQGGNYGGEGTMVSFTAKIAALLGKTWT